MIGTFITFIGQYNKNTHIPDLYIVCLQLNKKKTYLMTVKLRDKHILNIKRTKTYLFQHDSFFNKSV